MALFSGTDLLGQRHWSRTGSHSELITVEFQSLLQEHKIDIQQIRRIGVGVGPGSFTGLRVAINFSRALAYSLQLPILNCNSLELLCYQERLLQKKNLPVRVWQYAFRDLAYTCEYLIDQGCVRAQTKVEALTTSALSEQLTRPILVLGTGYEALKSNLSPEKLDFCLRDPHYSDLPEAENFRRTPLTCGGENLLSAWNQSIPLYIRASEAEEKLKKGAK